MYYIKNGLGKKWHWRAGLFAVFGILTVFGTGNATWVNTITAAINSALLNYNIISQENVTMMNRAMGIVIMLLVGSVLFYLLWCVSSGGSNWRCCRKLLYKYDKGCLERYFLKRSRSWYRFYRTCLCRYKTAGAELTILGFTSTYGNWVSVFSAVAMCCFAFSRHVTV